MPFHGKRSLAPGQLTELTASDTTSITIQNQGGNELWLFVWGDTAPTRQGAYVVVAAGEVVPNYRLADLAPGVSNARRVSALAPTAAEIYVSHP